MSAAQLILSLLGTEAVKSLAVETATGLLGDFLASVGPAKGMAPKGAFRSCRHCPWGKNGRAAKNSLGLEVVVPGRARVTVPGLRGDPERAAAVEAAVSRLEGVSEVQASLVTGRVLVIFDPAAVDPPAIRRAIKESDDRPILFRTTADLALVRVQSAS